MLDDARTGRARLFAAPVATIAVSATAEMAPAIAALRNAVSGGRHLAGFLSYEGARALSGLGTAPASLPLLWFGVFAEVRSVDPAELLPSGNGAWLGEAKPVLAYPAYAAAVTRAQEYIAAGDIYQVNLTFPATVPFAGHPLALYAGLRARAGAAWGGVVHTGEHWLLSLSPELFFTLDHGKLVTRPMKGTAARDPDPATDRGAAGLLASDPKQQAENLMIVDLLRNDLAQVAVAGSVQVPRLFEVETYPTVHQLTSTIVADLAAGHDAFDVLGALAPSGSVTGAPKRRALEVIDELEVEARGIYTGALGTIGPDGTSAAFNVAIRTLTLAPDGSSARLGLGSGITSGSNARDEWRECLAKGAFVPSPRRFDLVETMAFDPQVGILRLDAHLGRMAASADRFGFSFDRHRARNELQAATFRLRRSARLRLVVSARGGIAVEVRDTFPPPTLPVPVALAPLPVDPADFRLRHKTSDRRFYRTPGDAFDTVFLDPDGFVTEGGFTSVFVERDGVLLTPPLTRGLLPGILRAELLTDGRAREADLRADDLRDGFYLGNSLRGLLPARLRGL